MHGQRNRSRGRAARQSSWVRKAIFGVVPLVVLMMGVELVVRCLFEAPQIPSLSNMHRGTHMESHPTRMWTLRREMELQFGAVTRVGKDGLRAVETVGAPLRILTLGDSSIFGHALEDGDTLHAHLRSALREHGLEVDVLCGGIPGYSSAQSLLLLEEVGWDLEPDLILIGSLWSDNNMDRFVDEDLLALLNSPLTPLDRFLTAHSRAWQQLRLAIDPPGEAQTGETFSPVGWIQEPKPKPSLRRVSTTAYARNLDQMLVQAANRGVGAVMLQPVNPFRMTGEYDRTAWQSYFEIQKGIAERRGVPVVDGLVPLKAQGLSVEEAFLDELHPTGAANAAYASAVAGVLSEAGWPGMRLLPSGELPPYDRQLSDPWLEGTGGPAWK